MSRYLLLGQHSYDPESSYIVAMFSKKRCAENAKEHVKTYDKLHIVDLDQFPCFNTTKEFLKHCEDQCKSLQ